MQTILGVAMTFLDANSKESFMKYIIDKLYFIKIKNFGSAKDNAKKMRDMQTGEQYFQKTHLIMVIHNVK